MQRHAIDISNFSVVGAQQADFIKATQDIVVIGLQDSAKALAFKAQLLGGPELQYYVDLPGRDLSIPDRGAMVWIDIEVGCFQRAQDVRNQGTLNTTKGLRTGIYCNRTSLQPVFGDSSELADFGLPLWYASYIPPRWDWFIPFNGWTSPYMWQYAGSVDFQGVNCDLNITREELVRAINGVGVSFNDGTTQQLWPVVSAAA